MENSPIKRVKKIWVKGLFGQFDYEIPLNDLTIIHGINGSGKTSILKLADALLCFKPFVFSEIPFEEFGLEFSDLSKLRVNIFNNEGYLNVYFSPAGSKDESTKKINFNEIDKVITQKTPLHRLNDEEWMDFRTENIFSHNELLKQHWKENIPDGFPCHSLASYLIKSQRLYQFDTLQEDELVSVFTRRRNRIELSVNRFSIELQEIIGSKNEEYGKLSQKLEKNFPSRIFKISNIKPTYALDVIPTKLVELEEKRKRFMRLGILEKDDTFQSDIPGAIETSKADILAMYISDVEEKLTLFDSLADKIELLTTLINNKFRFKELKVSYEKGFVFITNKGEVLSPENLSSGEQHELVLAYELLFKTEPNTLILIDEPEISLHVNWQRSFLEDMESIIKLTGIQVLVATHSPQIIDGRNDILVGLDALNQ